MCPTRLPIATMRIGAIISDANGGIPRNTGIRICAPNTHQITP